MRKLAYLIMGVLLGTTCSCGNRPKAHGEGPLVGKEFEGYENCEYVSLYFVSDSDVIAYASSADFVGHFSDEVKGIYKLKDSHLSTTWKSVDKRNTKYTDVNDFLMADSIKFVADTIEMFVTSYIRQTIESEELDTCHENIKFYPLNI